MTSKRPSAAVLIFLVSLNSCAKRVAVAPVNQSNSNNRAASSPKPNSQLQGELVQIAALAKGRVGVSAIILETGEVVASLNPQDHFPMQSVYKLPISMAVVKQVDAGKLRLDQKVKISTGDYIGRNAHSPIRDKYPNGTELSVTELLQFALSESDGTASDVLMSLGGGAETVQAYVAELGIQDWKIVDTEKSLAQDNSSQFRNWATPDAAIALLRALHERRGLSESSQQLILKYMIESKPGARRLRGLLPADTVVAHKTGTSGTDKGVTAATNDIGIITLPSGKHLAIAVFVSDSPADEATREGVIARIAKSVWDGVAK